MFCAPQPSEVRIMAQNCSHHPMQLLMIDLHQAEISPAYDVELESSQDLSYL